MSQYPHSYGYGQYHGQPPPQPHPYPAAPGTSVPGLVDAYNPYAAQIHQDAAQAAQAAYNMNATHIPGLGIGAPPPGTAHQSFSYSMMAWGPPSGFPAPPPAPSPAPHAPTPMLFGATSFDSQSPQPIPASAGPSKPAKPPSQPAALPARPTAGVEMEEGELSEGQFEDLYEPREYVPSAPAQPAPLKAVQAADQSLPASAADTPDGGFYGSDEEDGAKDTKGNEGTVLKKLLACREESYGLTHAARERSASYSPFLSPRELQSEIPTPQPATVKGTQQGPSRPPVDKPKPMAPGLQLPKRPPVASPQLGSNSGQASSQPQKEQSSLFKSIQEAKKEAQKAVLRLWPLGVKYQNYMDEGFDEQLIKGLFRDLQLDIPKTATETPAVTQTKETQPPQARKPDSAKTAQTPGAQSHPAPPASTGAPTPAAAPSATSDESKKGEERKDRIARLLAAKAAKAPLPAPPKPPTPTTKHPKQPLPEKPPQEPASAPSPPTQPQNKSWGEKGRLLQQKLAALQMSRAQKSATDAAATSAPQTGGSGTPLPQTEAGSPAALPVPTGPRAASLPQPPALAQPTPTQPRLPIAGLALPTAPVNPPGQRKRPVALDFVEYSTGPVPPKRPFGQARQETSLIIDVSDASDDEDMEMDMDLGSPVDEALPAHAGSTAGLRGPAIRDFPPLTDTFPQRQFSSPAPSITPPNGGPANNKRHELELGLKEKAIQEMRRKIALAEARRKVKQASGGSVTPTPAAATPELGEVPHGEAPSPQLTPGAPSSARLLKPSEMSRLDPQKRAERRGRLMSLEIPNVESSLKQKLSRLQQLQEEQERLRAEIDRSFAEQKRLAEELDQLDESPLADTPQPNGLDAEPESAPSTAARSPPVAEPVDDQPAADVPPPSGSEESQEPGASPTDDVETTPAVDTQAEVSNLESPGGEVVGDSAGQSPHASPSRESSLPEGEAQGQEDADNASISPPAPASFGITTAVGHLPEPHDAANADENTPMELDSRSPSPDAAGPASGIEAGDNSPSTGQPDSPVPDQISSVAQPREALQEIESETTGEVNVVSSREENTMADQNYRRMTNQRPSRAAP